MTPGSRALHGYDGHRFQALAVAVWDDLTQQGLRVRDANAPASDGEGGVSLMLKNSGVTLSWQAHDDIERILYDKSLRAERSRSIAAVMTGALASTLATLGYQVRAEFRDVLPAPALLVESGPKP